MAAQYVFAMRTVQPQGPYALGGWSLGGNIAYEIAQQLAEAGDEIALLFMIESSPTLGLKKKSFGERVRDFQNNIAFNISLAASGLETIRDGLYVMTSDSWFGRGLRKGNGRLLKRMKDFGANALWKVYAKKAHISSVVGQDEQLLLIKQPSTRQWLRIAAANLKAFKRYRPRPYRGSVVLFKSELKRQVKAGADPSQGWGGLAQGGCEVFTVPGDHFSLLRNPHVSQLAGLLAKQLSDVERAPTR
jgi:thioesterase domain-containing protein